MQKIVFILNNTIMRVKPRPRTAAAYSKGYILALVKNATKNIVSVPAKIFLPQSYKNWCEEIGWVIKNQAIRKKWKFVESGAIKIDLDIEQIKSRGDNDNLLGSIMDALQGVVYADDCLITESHCRLKKTQKNTIVVTISVIPEDELSMHEWADHAAEKQAGSRKGRKTQFDKRLK